MSKGFYQAGLDRMDRVMAGHVGDRQPGLVTLLSRGDEVHVGTYGLKAFGESAPMQRDTLFRIASMTKPIAAVAALILVEECRLRLDEPLDEWLPELADRRVLKRLDGPLDETVPADRPLSLRDLLTLRLGFGHIMEPGDYPIMQATLALGLLDGGALPHQLPAPDEWLRRFAGLPLMHQPGEVWMYDLGIDLLGILIGRVAGQSLGAFLQERIFAPLGMQDTGFMVPEAKLGRLATAYTGQAETGAPQVYDAPADSSWSRPLAFESAAGGLVSTVDDYSAFCRMLLGKGRLGGERILSRPSVELMTSDQLTPRQVAEAGIFFGGTSSWGFGISVMTRRDSLEKVPGRFGWDGGLGTSAYSDPHEDLVGILMTQRVMDSPIPPRAFQDFWTCAYAALDA